MAPLDGAQEGTGWREQRYRGRGEATSFVKFAEGAGADSDSDVEEASMLEAIFCKFFFFF